MSTFPVSYLIIGMSSVFFIWFVSVWSKIDEGSRARDKLTFDMQCISKGVLIWSRDVSSFNLPVAETNVELSGLCEKIQSAFLVDLDDVVDMKHTLSMLLGEVRGPASVELTSLIDQIDTVLTEYKKLDVVISRIPYNTTRFQFVHFFYSRTTS